MVAHARQKFSPPEKMTVSEWADRYRVMSKEESSFPGPWQTDRVPYLRKIMDAWNDDEIEYIVFIKSTQVGATEAGINIIGYTIDQDPSRLLYLMPDDDIAKDFSADRLQKALERCEVLKDKYNAEDSKNSVLRFQGGFIKLSGAQSPGKLASWAVPKLFMDEIDKYPRWAGREASPLKLAEERTKNWPNRKIFIASTPTVESGNITQAYREADVKYKFYIQCPKCGQWQKLEFGNLKIPHQKGEKADPTYAREHAYYQCANPSCQHHITDAEKIEQEKSGRWCIDGEPPEGKPKKVAFSINALYSPWVTFGRVAEEFIRSKDDPADLMNFVNSWLGEPWKPKTETIATKLVLRQKTDIPAYIIPKWARLLTAGVDCQQGYFYWVVRAWGPNLTSQKIANGEAITWGDLQKVMDNWWPIEGSDERQQISLYAIDSGYRPEDVYEYCLDNYPNCIPVKGASRPMEQRYKKSSVTPDQRRSMIPLNLYVVDTDQYKNLIFARMERDPKAEGSWRVDANTSQEYADMICAEHREETMKNGVMTVTWKPNKAHAQNHYLDCEVYAWVAADAMNVSLIGKIPEHEEVQNGEQEVDRNAIVPNASTWGEEE